MVAALEEVDQGFWQNDMELGADLILRRIKQAPDWETRWVGRLTPARRRVLQAFLGLSAKVPKESLSDKASKHGRLLDNLLLVEALMSQKSTNALLRVAQSTLTPEQLELCREGKKDLDRVALGWMLFRASSDALKHVFQLDKVHKSGFARLRIAHRPSPAGCRDSSIFDVARIQSLLDEDQSRCSSRRTTICTGVMEQDDSRLVFIKRDLKPDFVAEGPINLHGHRQEWLVLDFAADMTQADVTSVSPEMPIQYVALIASAYFGEPVRFQNAQELSSTEQVKRFLQALVAGPEPLPVVEFSFRNSGLIGSPRVRLSIEDGSLVQAILQFAGAFGDPLARVEDIESLKVEVFGMRIKLLFEVVARDQFVVRYTDKPLAPQNRKAFVAMMEQKYGLNVLSTEKRRDGR